MATETGRHADRIDFWHERPQFAFYGNVADQRNAASARSWQLASADRLIARVGGTIMPTLVFFDEGVTRPTPWQRRPAASSLLRLATTPQPGFTGIVVTQARAFPDGYCLQLASVLARSGIELWTPETSGPVDPGLIMHSLVIGTLAAISRTGRASGAAHDRSLLSVLSTAHLR